MANVMIVDDSPMIRRSLRSMIEALGHCVTAEAVDGRDAIEVYKKGNEIDLVTMDIQLPGMDGIEAVRQIREQNPEAVIVMISSVEERGRVYEAIKLGAKHYIIKPFTEEKVNQVLTAVLGTCLVEVQEQSVDPIKARLREMEEERKTKNSRQPIKLEVPTLGLMPFELVLKDGKVVLTIQRHINDSNIRYLQDCLQGLLYYRKAKYVIDLWEPIHHDGALGLILDFFIAVRNRNGTVGVVTADFGYYTQLQAKLRNGVYRSYAHIEW
jgi:two-component system chemotaxis response regulator CheY